MPRPQRIGVAAIVISLALPAVPGHAARTPKLRAAPFTVVAVVDSGIDPYHLDFRNPGLTSHPSTYIEGFPKGAKALDLSLDAKTYSAATKADADAWSKIKNNELYWIPGTNIVGAIGPFDQGDLFGFDTDLPDPAPFLDTIGHGTAVASRVGGSIHGPDTDKTLIVVVKGFEDGVAWAASQPWIDVISASWWSVQPDDYAAGAEATKQAVANGKTVCFASGNFSHPQLYTGTQGPSWTINVGAASEKTRGEHYYTDYPNDVLGLSGGSAAQFRSFDGEAPFFGTSASAPNVCGLIAKTLSEVRAHLDDGTQGARPRSIASGARGSGYLKDGVLTRAELEDAVQATARPAEASGMDPDDPYALPASPVAPFARGGYGIVDSKSTADALEVIFGTKPRPDRTLEDQWIALTDAARDAIWGNLVP